MIRTRFAPSPTGEMHIGNARSALFAYLFAKHNKGNFALRIEDTDRERYVEGSVERMLDMLKWLGIERDNEELFIQSEHLDDYKKAAFSLVESGKAYICTCTKERLTKLREEQQAKGIPTGYDRHCRDIQLKVSNIKEMEEYLAKGGVVRMKMPESGKIKFKDLIRGEVEFDLSLLDDQVILKSDGFPTYHLASIIDDHAMEITHVIRSEEWLPSTPKHIVLYEMFGWEAPQFAHLPMILGSDKKKLSKRHGATSVVAYKEEGYLPEALVNFMVFLGWNPKDEREIFSMEELIAEFKLENVNKAGAIFDLNKLNSISAYYIKEQVKNQKSKIKSTIQDLYHIDLTDGELDLIGRGGYITLKEAAEYIEKLRNEPEYDANMLVFKKSTKEATLKGLQAALEELKNIEDKDWGDQEVQMRLSLIVPRENLTNGDVFWPVRVALSGEEKSPSPVELAVALGREETIKRIDAAIKALQSI